MALVTLAALRTRCQQESDNVGSSFITNAEWASYINASYQDLYGQIVQAFGNDYFLQTPQTGYTFTTDGVNQFFALPSTFFKLLGVDLQLTGANAYVSLRPFAFADRNKYSIANSFIPQAGQTVRVWYVPQPTLLSADTDTIDGVNGWEEFIVIDACIKALTKEESDVSVFLQRRGMMSERLASEIENRDAANPATVVDTLYRRGRAMQYRLNGNSLWLIGNGQPGWQPYGDWGADDAFGPW